MFNSQNIKSITIKQNVDGTYNLNMETDYEIKVDGVIKFNEGIVSIARVMINEFSVKVLNDNNDTMAILNM